MLEEVQMKHRNRMSSLITATLLASSAALPADTVFIHTHDRSMSLSLKKR